MVTPYFLQVPHYTLAISIPDSIVIANFVAFTALRCHLAKAVIHGMGHRAWGKGQGFSVQVSGFVCLIPDPPQAEHLKDLVPSA